MGISPTNNIEIYMLGKNILEFIWSLLPILAICGNLSLALLVDRNDYQPS
jgi:hypothetical protein